MRTFTLGPTPQNVNVYLDDKRQFGYDVDHTKMTAKLARIPAFNEVPYPVQMEPHLVVEYYSR